jgi:hypothetical protein
VEIGEEYSRQIVDLSLGQRKRYLGHLKMMGAARVRGSLLLAKPSSDSDIKTGCSTGVADFVFEHLANVGRTWCSLCRRETRMTATQPVASLCVPIRSSMSSSYRRGIGRALGRRTQPRARSRAEQSTGLPDPSIQHGSA